MLVGVWINGLAFVPYGLLQAQGRPDLTAKFHVAELVPFAGLLWLGVHFAGVTGGAVVWCIRVAADGALMLAATGIFRVVIMRLLPGMAVIGLAFIATTLVGDHLATRGVVTLFLGGLSLFITHSTTPEVTRLVSSQVVAAFCRNRIDVVPEAGS
jgi:hypothetical protein